MFSPTSVVRSRFYPRATEAACLVGTSLMGLFEQQAAVLARSIAACRVNPDLILEMDARRVGIFASLSMPCPRST